MDILKLLQKILYSCTMESTYTKYKLNILYYYSLSKLSNKAKTFLVPTNLPSQLVEKNKWQMPEIYA